MKANRVIITEENNPTAKIIENCEFSIDFRVMDLIERQAVSSMLRIKDSGIPLEFRFNSMYTAEKCMFFHIKDLTIKIELDAN